MPQEPKASYLTADHLGSPRIVTDGIGTVVSRHDYLAFGDEVTETLGDVGGRTPAQGYGNEDEIRQGYTGYENDKESGLEYAQARYYNASHGRYTSVDPLTASASIRDPQTFNRYSYVLNSPYKFTDPLGLLAWCSTCQTSDGDNGGFADPVPPPVPHSNTNAADNAPATAVTSSGDEGGEPAQQKEEGYYFNKQGLLVCDTGCPSVTTNITPQPLVQMQLNFDFGGLDVSFDYIYDEPDTDTLNGETTSFTRFVNKLNIRVTAREGLEIPKYTIEFNDGYGLRLQRDLYGNVVTKTNPKFRQDIITPWEGVIKFENQQREIRFSFETTTSPNRPGLTVGNIKHDSILIIGQPKWIVR